MLTTLFFFLTLIALCAIQVVYHFTMVVTGRVFGVQAREVIIGFGPRIYSFNSSKLVIRISLLPMGGHTKFEDNEGETNPDEDGTDDPATTNQFATAKPLVKMLIVASGPVAVVLMGISLLSIPILLNAPQLEQSPPNQSVIKHCGVQGLKFGESQSTLPLQFHFFRTTAIEFTVRLVTFQSLDGWGGVMAFLATASEIGVISLVAWLTCIGVVALWTGFTNLLPVPMFNGFHIVNALFELMTGRAIPDRLHFWLSMTGLLATLFFWGRMFFVDILWVWQAIAG